jgi:putative tryptophan/tyrosine transport system substrate-binding protein
MKRREFISLIGGVAATWPLAVQAQQPALPVVGLLRTEPAESFVTAFRRGLSDLMGRMSRSIFVRVAVIVANTNATPYAISATKSIPIVFVTGRDPIAAGFVPNLNHPGGNVSFFRF